MAKAVDAIAVLKQLDEQEAEALQAFQDQVRARREKALTDVLKPLKDERARLGQTRNEADMRIAEIDKMVAKLMGRAEPKAKGPRRQRVNRASKLQTAQIIYGLLKQHSGKRYSSRELDAQSDGIPVRDLVKIWNEDNSDRRIDVEGEKVNTRYFVGK